MSHEFKCAKLVNGTLIVGRGNTRMAAVFDFMFKKERFLLMQRARAA